MKKKLIAKGLMAVSVIALTACQSGLDIPSPQDNSGITMKSEKDIAGDTENTEADAEKNRKDTSEYDRKDVNDKDDTAETELSPQKAIEMAGKAYDGYEASRDKPTVDYMLLNHGSFLDESSDRLLEACDTEEEREAAREYQKISESLKGYFRRVKYYEPKDGITIGIANKKLYEYKISDTEEILKLYKKMLELMYSLPGYGMTYSDDMSAGTWLKGSMNMTGSLGAMNNYIMEADGFAAEAASAPEEAPLPMPTSAEKESFDWNTEEYKSFSENRFMSTKASPFSTFGMDIDTASYGNLRKKVFNGRDIPVDSVRTEEMLNYFDYDYVKPKGDDKFGVTVEMADTPWNEDTKLLRIGVKAEEAATGNISSNVVFLIDTSGSMFDHDKLPLVQKSFLMLLDGLDEDDKISIVTYAGGDTVICEGVTCNRKEEITEDILSLEAWGGTNGAAGIKTAYELARDNYIEGGNNRVILATDGDLNIGASSESELVEIIKKEKESNVFLSVLGVGTGNYKDSKMKALADNGNGNFAYIDSTSAADKALRKDFNSLMYTVAEDAKMQVEFNPDKIKGYRQIGYELRQLDAEDFADDTRDGSEIGSGQCVTVLYEIVPVDSSMEIPDVKTKYGNDRGNVTDTDELLTVSIRYKQPGSRESILMEVPVTGDSYNEKMSSDMSWAAGVAQTAMVLKDSEYKGNSSYSEIYEKLIKNPDIKNDTAKAQFLYMLKELRDKSS